MEEHDWLFDVLAELSLYSEQVGYVVLAEALTLCMDAFELDERRMQANQQARDRLMRLQRCMRRLPRHQKFAISTPERVQQGPLSTGLMDHVGDLIDQKAA